MGSSSSAAGSVRVASGTGSGSPRKRFVSAISTSAAAKFSRANDSRRKPAQRNGNIGEHRSGAMSASDVLNFVTSRLPDPSILQIGGNETIGKGLCAVRFYPENSAGGNESAI